MKFVPKTICFAFFLLFINFFEGVYEKFGSAHASETNILEILVQGAKRIDPETIISFGQIELGEKFDEVKLNEIIKKLFDTGLFADVQLSLQDGLLTVFVEENPLINRVVFEGNDRIDSEDLERELQLKPRQVLTRTKVQQDTQRLLDIYRVTGRFGVKVQPQLVMLEQNRVDLIFEIDEGKLSKISKISFIGNDKFSDSKLRDVIQSKEDAFYRFLTSDSTYDPDRLNFDGELLRRFYLNNGFIDFQVVSTVGELSTGDDSFAVTFTLDEGKRYRLGKITLESAVEDINIEDLHHLLKGLEGGWYNARLINKAVDRLVGQLGLDGFAFVDIKREIKRNVNKNAVVLALYIAKTPRVYVERINIEGNSRTLDAVIRREFDLLEGDAFNVSKLRRARRSIRNLGFFSKTKVDSMPGSSKDKTIIRVSVEEKSTGEISLGAGFSSQDGPLANIGIRERNLLGKGQDLTFNFKGSAARQEFKIGFTEPYFLDRDVSAGFDLVQSTTDRQTESSFDERKAGGGLRLGYSLGPDLRQRLKYSFERTQIRNVDDQASIFIKEQEGNNTVSQVGHTTSYDRLDNRRQPSKGYAVSLTNDLAGLGGDARHLRSKLRAGYFVPILEDQVLSFRLETGYIKGIGKDVKIGERFFLGGRKIRGFAPSGIGPRDLETKDVLGGNQYYTGSVELRFPIGLPNELGLKASIFSDVGSLSGLDQNSSQIEDSSGLRASVGMGLSWATGIGLMRLDFASAMLKEELDETEFISFSFGTGF
jgi:outer membrane protein insertion porin family